MQRIAKRCEWKWRLLAAALMLAALLWPGMALADDLYVDGGATYTVNSDITFDIEGIGFASTGTLNQNAFTNTVNDNIYLGFNPTGSGTYNLSGTGSLSVANHLYVGNFGTGTFTHTGGTNTVTGLMLGYNTTGVGTYNLSGSGSLSASWWEYLGYYGTGTFNQSGGTNTVTDDLILGIKATGVGTYNLSGSGSLSVGQDLLVGNEGAGTFTHTDGTNTVTIDLILGYKATTVGIYNLSGGSLSVGQYLLVGNEGTGTFTQDGGTNTVTGFKLGYNNTGVGTYNLSGSGSLSAYWEDLGYSGTGTFNQSGGTNTAEYLYLGVATTGSGTYNLSGGSLSVANRLYVGNFGTGTFTQDGGTNTVTGLTLGYNNTGVGTYNLSGGSLSAGDEVIGSHGTGTFNQNGGTNTVAGLMLGYNNTGVGTYNLSGGGSLSAGDEVIGSHGTGTFNQEGGTNTISDSLYLGRESSGIGTYNLSGGSLSAAYESIGYFGTGTFTQTGGNHSVTDLVLGTAAGSSGTYNLSGTGSLSAYWEDLGYCGTGTFNHTDGTNTVTYALMLGTSADGSGTYNLSGGSLSAGDELIGSPGIGTFNQTGGTHTVTDDLSLGASAGGSGTYNLSGSGSLSAYWEDLGYYGTGTFNQSGGTNTVTYALMLGTSAGGSGTYNLSGSGSLSAYWENLGYCGTGTFNQSGGTHTAEYLNLGVATIASGTYNLSGGSLSVGQDLLIGDRGSGTFTQTGGTNTVSGNLIIANYLGSAGTYSFLGGSLSADTIQVNPGGTFMGVGTLSAKFTNSGLVKPGTSVGTLTIEGSYTQTADGTLEVEIASATSYDKLQVTGSPGNASLAGTVSPVLLGGYKPYYYQIFPGVITTTGVISGEFDAVANQNATPTLLWQPQYTTTSFNLLLRRDYTNPALPLTPNQRAVGNILNGLAYTATGDLEDVLNAIDHLPSGAAVADAYQQISPDKATALPALGLMGATQQMRNLARRITDLRFGARELDLAGSFPGSLNLFGSRTGGVMLAYNGASLAGMITAKRQATPETRWGLWLDPVGLLGRRDSTLNQTGYDFSLAGFTLGCDYRVGEHLLVGLATGYSHTSADFFGSGGSVTNNTWPITAYAAYLPQSFYAFGSLGYSLNLFDLKRQISFGGLSRTAQSSPTGHQFNAYGEAGYDLKLNRLVVTPAVSLAYSKIWVDSFTESGAGALNLNVASQSADSLQTGVGAKVAAPLKVNSTLVVPQVYASYQHEFMDDSRGLDARLSQAGSTFTFTTDRPSRDFAVVGGNVTVWPKKNVSAYINYNAEVGRSNSTAHNINAGLRWEF